MPSNSGGSINKGGVIILVDSAIGSKELEPIIRGMGVKCEKDKLPYSDAFFEGKGPKGTMGVGFERKRLHDMITCITDSRYSAHQKVGMSLMCGRSYLIIEGIWRPRLSDGVLLEGFSKWDGYKETVSWIPCKFQSVHVRYETLHRYLISIANAGVTVTYSRDVWHTCFDIVQHYHWYQKPWHEHLALRQLQKFNLPSLTGKPSVTRQWANALDGIGIKHSENAERVFKTPIKLATADEMEWLKIDGIGVPTAQRIVRTIQGWD